jgi:TPR repeat protein
LNARTSEKTSEMTSDSNEIERLQKAAAGGDVKSMVDLAYRYYSGTDVERNFDKAAELYKKAAKAGSTAAQLSLGAFYEFATSVPADLTESMNFYQQATAQGNIRGQIASFRLEGLGVESKNGKINKAELFEQIERETTTARQIGANSSRELALACDLRKDYVNGLKYLRKCLLAPTFKSFPVNSRLEVKTSVYFRAKGYTDYFKAIASSKQLRILPDRALRVFIPDKTSGYSATLRKIILNSIQSWNSALSQHFEVVEVTDNNAATLSFVPVNLDSFFGLASARTCYRPQQSPTVVVSRLLRTLVTQNPLSSLLGPGQSELILKPSKMEVQFPNYPCTSKDDFTNMTTMCLHEIGHALGLAGHSIFGDDIMYSEMNHLGTLSARDIQAINSLYKDNAEYNVLTILKNEVQEDNPYALCCLGINRVLNSRYESGIDLLTRASALEDAEAQLYLALCYSTGSGVEKDQKTAIELLEKSVTQGNPQAHTALGLIYTMGTGVKPNATKASELFAYAAEHGNTNGARYLAVVTALKDHGTFDPEKLALLLQQADASGIPATKLWEGVHAAVQYFERMFSDKKNK